MRSFKQTKGAETSDNMFSDMSASEYSDQQAHLQSLIIFVTGRICGESKMQNFVMWTV